MIPLLVRTALILALVFGAAGLALSKAWGWPERASDALYLVYQNKTRVGAPTTFVIDANGSAPEPLAYDDMSVMAHACSSDGRWLAFTAAGDLYRQHNGGLPERISSEALGGAVQSALTQLSISDSGDVLMTSIGYPNRLWLIDDERAVPLTLPLNYALPYAALSPDGLWVAFEGSDIPYDYIYMGDLQSNTVSQRRIVGSHPNWIGDGQMIAFETALYADLQVSSRVRLFDVSRGRGYLFRRLEFPDFGVTWSPDGQQIAFVDYSGDPYLSLFVGNLLTGERQALAGVSSALTNACFLSFRPMG
jgi:hypothetical protein